jgi:repressor LexA
MMDAEDQKHLMKLLQLNKSRLRPLEEQAAIYGSCTSPEVLIEIEKIRKEIAHIELELGKNNVQTVPLLGVITAGSPLPDPEDTSSSPKEMVEVPSEIVEADKLAGVYALRVRGHSMIEALIDDGDIVLLRYQEMAENGQTVAVFIDGDNSVTLKKLYRENSSGELFKRFDKKSRRKESKKGSYVRLQPANVRMKPIYVHAAKIHIQGVVVGVLRKT